MNANDLPAVHFYPQHKGSNQDCSVWNFLSHTLLLFYMHFLLLLYTLSNCWLWTRPYLSPPFLILNSFPCETRTLTADRAWPGPGLWFLDGDHGCTGWFCSAGLHSCCFHYYWWWCWDWAPPSAGWRMHTPAVKTEIRQDTIQCY